MSMQPGNPPQQMPVQPFQPSMPQLAPQLNYCTAAEFRGGWIAIFSGENQAKALDRVLRDLNSRGHKVAAAVDDRWSIWKRLGMILLAIITLGFYVRVPNVILITEPVR